MCTGIRIKSKTGDYFWGRTMDLSFPMFGDDTGMPASLNNLVVVTTVPAGVEVASEATPWTSKYTAIGMGVKNTPVLFDGINEKGLAGDTQVLMEADYGSAADIAARKQTALLAEEFVTFILTQYSTVAEIKADYAKFALVNGPYKALGQSISMTLHFSFVDPTGDGIVLEPVNDGAFKMYDFIGVMTNSPEYDWHLINVRNYIHLTNIDPTGPATLPTGYKLEPIEGGTGFGMFGLPGDYTAPSRMVRALNLSSYLRPFDSAEGIDQLYAAFRTVIIPPGLEHSGDNNPMSDYSQYWVGYDLTNQTLYIQSAVGLAISSKKLDAGAAKEITYQEVDLTDNVKVLA